MDSILLWCLWLGTSLSSDSGPGASGSRVSMCRGVCLYVCVYTNVYECAQRFPNRNTLSSQGIS